MCRPSDHIAQIIKICENLRKAIKLWPNTWTTHRTQILSKSNFFNLKKS